MEILPDEVPARLGRSLLAVDLGDGHGANAFLFNHLVEKGPPDGMDSVLTFLVTTRAVASRPTASVVLARHMIKPIGAAMDLLAFPRWPTMWKHAANDTPAIAMMPFLHLEEHGRSKGWSWDTQEVTDGMLLAPGAPLEVRTDEFAAYGYEADVGPDRRPALHSVGLAPRPDGSAGIVGAAALLPGALVIGLAPVGDGNLRFVVAGVIGSAEAGDLPSTPRPMVAGSEIRRVAQEIFDAASGRGR